ncbi:hypothetical protein J7T55_003751 [Diaporthe amygdali]|uniref:uncharacterized protein n=1 Tax=Phomopsis amygdali TaxID=1214568 RepID=UPI0022FE895F|nr:uncharacterized protein J7T55_003751 [Diaporthe amygdali]KAJ0117337.1 hypothetical protein J7T55_003751 [Diaporthe amygdali]
MAEWLHRELTEKREDRGQAKCQLRDELFGSFCTDGEPAQVRTFNPNGVDAQKIEAVLREDDQLPSFGSMSTCEFEQDLLTNPFLEKDVLEVFPGSVGTSTAVISQD